MLDHEAPDSNREVDAPIVPRLGLSPDSTLCASELFSIDLLVDGERRRGLDFTIPPATLVPIGTVAAFYGVRHRDWFVGHSG